MAISGSTKIKIDFSQPYQLILGKNGSGKSSLLEELSPLPAHQSNYSKGGYKIVVIEHRGKTYRLESRFGKDIKHFFITEDEENLNEGGTVTVQRELVKQHFGITPEIHKLLSGLDPFTEMDTGKRREWFTKLSVADYTYAVTLYNRIKDSHRDTLGALKIAKNRLVAETNKTAKPEDIEKLEAEVVSINNELRLLYENKSIDHGDYNELLGAEATLSEKIEKIIAYIADTAASFAKTRLFTNIGEAEQMYARLEEAQVILKTKIKEAVERIEEMRSEHRRAMSASATNVGDLQTRSEALKKLIASTLSSRVISIPFDSGIADAKQRLDAFDQMHDGFLEYSSRLIADPDRTATSEVERALVEKMAARDLTSKMILDDERKVKDQILHMEHQKDGGETECPKCAHRWIPGYSAKTYEDAKIKLSSILAAKEKIGTEINSIRTEHNRVTAILFAQSEINRYMQAWPNFGPFWKYLSAKNVYRNDPQSIGSELQHLRHDLWLECEAREHEIHLEKISAELAIIANSDLQNTTQVIKKHDELEDRISNLTQDLVAVQDKLKRYKFYIESWYGTQKALEEAVAICTEREKNVDETIHSIRQTIIEGCIKRHQITLGMKEKELNDIRMQAGIVRDLQRQIEGLTSKVEEFKAVLAALSPTEGLIAEGMLGFIKVFVAKMNHLIGKTWSYPLEVVPCGLNSEGSVDLDYKFPLISEASNRPVPDVVVGSRGMKEIVNLVFRVVALQYLGLADVPLYLDEFASALDSSHRRSSVDLIKMMMTQMSFSQMFMVSHDFSQYGALSDVEVCALTEDNIVLPPKYNEHVSFT